MEELFYFKILIYQAFWFLWWIGNNVCRGIYFQSTCYQSSHPTYLTDWQTTSWETLGLEEAQAGIKIAGRNINNLRYANDTTFMAESEE